MRVFRRSKFQRHIVLPVTLVCFIGACGISLEPTSPPGPPAPLIVGSYSFSYSDLVLGHYGGTMDVLSLVPEDSVVLRFDVRDIDGERLFDPRTESFSWAPSRVGVEYLVPVRLLDEQTGHLLEELSIYLSAQASAPLRNFCAQITSTQADRNAACDIAWCVRGGTGTQCPQ
jgi:hypothetical protein